MTAFILGFFAAVLVLWVMGEAWAAWAAMVMNKEEHEEAENEWEWRNG